MGKDNKIFDKNYLKQNGIDAEEVKDEYVSDGGHYDIYYGETVTIESKDGRKVVDTGLSKDSFFKLYGNSEEEER